MSIYRFGENSLLDAVTTHHTAGGGVRAYLHAREGSDAGKIDALKKSLTGHALQWTPIQEDGKPVLEVRGFGNKDSDLLKLLSMEGVISHRHTKEATPDDKLSFKDKFRKNTLSLSGLAYFIGDMGFIFYGYREAFTKEPLTGKNKLTNLPKLLAGVFYAAGSPFLTFFGRGDKSNIQLKHLSYNLIHELEDKGFDVPQDSAAQAVANGHNATRWKKIVTFCNRYPAEIANSMFGAAGAMLMTAEAKELKTFKWTPIKDFKAGGWKKVAALMKRERIPGQSAHDPHSVLLDIGLGFMSVMAGLISVFVEEEVPKPEDKKETGVMGRILQKIKQKPLAAAGISLMVATGMHGVSTYKDWKWVSADLAKGNPLRLSAEQLKSAMELKKSLRGRSTFVVTNLAAEGLMAVSSKGHGAGVKSDQSLEKSAYGVAADLIQRTEPEKREALLDTISQFYAHRKHLAGDPEAIKKGIREQLDSLNENPWTGLIAAQRAPASASSTKENTNWQGKIMASQMTPATIAPAL